MFNSVIRDIANSINPSIPEGLERYVEDPVSFTQDLFGTTVIDDQKTIAESVLKNRITLIESATGTGKTFMAARIALWFARCHRGSQVYLINAPPEENLKRLLWAELDSAIAVCDPLVVEGLEKRTLKYTYSTEAKWWIEGLTVPTTGTETERESRFSGKHAPYLLFVVDEANAIPHEVWRGIEGCLSGGFTRALVMLNPRETVGWAYELRDQPGVCAINLSAFNHPNVITGKNIIPGAVDREITVKRIQSWTRLPVRNEELKEETTFFVPEYLDGCTYEGTPDVLVANQARVINDELFFYVVLGQYPQSGGTQLIPNSWVKQAQTRWQEYFKEHKGEPPESIPPIIGIDIGDEGGDETVACYRYANYVPHLMAWNDLDPETSGDKIVNIIGDDNNYERIYVDANGLGAGVPRQLRRKGVERVSGVLVSEKATKIARTTGGEPMGRFFSKRDEILWMVREWLRPEKGSMLPPDSALERELMAPKVTQVNGRIKITPKNKIKKMLGGRSCNRLDSLALTFAEGGAIKMGFV